MIYFRISFDSYFLYIHSFECTQGLGLFELETNWQVVIVVKLISLLK